MSKQSLSAQLIEHAAKRGYTPEQTASLLDKFELLAPDLLEPSPGPDGALLWHNEQVWVEDDESVVYTDLPKSFGRMTPSQTRRLGYALIAAANHAEAEDD